MFCDNYTTIVELIDWMYDELNTGSRIKASKINRVKERIEERRRKWFEKYAESYLTDC